MEVDIAARRVRRSGQRPTEARRRSERELAVLYRQDPSSREEIVRALLPLARGMAARYRRGEEPLEDLEQVATVGLLKALRGFDPERGTSFAAFAIPTINGELRRHYRDTGWAVHVPRGTQELALKVSRAEQEAAKSGSVPATAGDLATKLDVTIEAVVAARIAARGMRAGSLEAPAPAAAYEPGADRDTGFEAAEQRATLSRLTAGLSERDRQVLALRYGGDLSQSEIGRRVGVSQMQVSRILRRVVAQLQEEAAA